MVRVERVTEDAWERYATLRLRALRDDRAASASTLAREEGFGEQHWRMRLRAAPTWVAEVDGADAGLVGAIEEPGAPADERHVVQLWVAPAYRRRGAGRALLDAVERWALGAGARTLTLWHVEGPDEAAAFYRACGWVASDVAVPMPRDPRIVERRWTRPLTAG